ncbi:MAG: GNAT family N-acyltransferase [Paracoccaceae bacterium]|nr:GNAT family N-acyltransferase [Paracoccaceae bacterium]
MKEVAAHFTVRLAETEADLLASQRLRYQVFVSELGGDGPLVDHEGQFERDEFDPFYEHLVLVDTRRNPEDLDHVIGVYRLLSSEGAAKLGRYYSEDEFDLTKLRESGLKLLELGRSCVSAEHRGGTAMFLLWNALAGYVLSRDYQILFGVASFHGVDTKSLAMPLSHLYHNHLAPPELRVTARGENAHAMDIIKSENIERVSAMKSTPALIKAYLRLGGFVGEGAFVDHAFNTTDICLIMDTTRMSQKHRKYYTERTEK